MNEEVRLFILSEVKARILSDEKELQSSTQNHADNLVMEGFRKGSLNTYLNLETVLLKMGIAELKTEEL